MSENVLQQLEQILIERRSADPAESYVASLHQKGLNKILEKVGEEATEVILAAKDAEGGGEKDALLEETADLWFHTLVMLSHLDSSADEVLARLASRLGVSGLAEKAARSNT
ncbi:MAG: phosphoribosyl-ATP diphosphatase [Pseudomonadota bacterium]